MNCRRWIAAAITTALLVGVTNARQESKAAQPTDTQPPSDPAQVVEWIARHALTHKETYASLVDLTTKAPHRLSGSPGAAAAVEWAKHEMETGGFENVRLEPCMVPHWVRGDIAELKFAGPGEAIGEPLPILALGGSEPTSDAGITAEVIMVETFDELAKRKDEAVGKIVLFNHPMRSTNPSTFSAYGDAVGYRSRGAHEAGKAGAVAAIVRSMTTRLDDYPHTGGMRYRPGPERIPTAAVSTLGAERIARHIRAGRKVSLHFRQNCRWKEDAPSFNVVGELVGSEKPEEIVLVGGHLDGWDVGHGAHDDGAGTCHAISAVRTLKKLGLRPKRTIRCVLFMNEENGLEGAKAYLEAHRDELDRHVFAVESDRGGFTPRGFTTDANPEAFAILTEYAKHFRDLGADRIVRGSGGADINVLRDAGVPLAGFLPDPHRYFDLHHSGRDTIDKVNERELELGMVSIASLIYFVANADEALPRNPKPSN